MGKNIQIEIYDCTLRDGAQGEGIDFSVDNKAHIAGRLDKMGREDRPGLLVQYIEGGYPGSNPKDVDFFNRMKKAPLSHSQITAFGSTRYKNKTAEEDMVMRDLLAASTKTVTIFGKSWDFHIDKVLRTTLENNLEMIKDSVSYLKAKGKQVFFDAEHFFNGYLGNSSRGIKGNPEYALETLVAAAEAGAERLILCETNGGVPLFNHQGVLEDTVEYLRSKGIDAPLGIHAHNDGGFAVANTLYAVEVLNNLGEKHFQIQGTINGFGERTGNADLVQIIANLDHNGYSVGSKEALRQLTEISRYVYAMAGIEPEGKQPFVGTHGGHKGGMHINAIRKDPRTYEHFDLGKYGNASHLVASEQSGKTTIYAKARQFGVEFDENFADKFLTHIKNLEHKGYSFDAADASLELHMRRELSKYLTKRNPKAKIEHYEPLVIINQWDVEITKKGHEGDPVSRSVFEVRVGGEPRNAIKRRVGPVEALDVAFREVLEPTYPYLSEVRVLDYRVHSLEPKKGTAATVRVNVSAADNSGHEWSTVAAHPNIMEASWNALMDAYEFGLRKYAPEQIKPQNKTK